jgi:cytoskeletal protein RodZ
MTSKLKQSRISMNLTVQEVSDALKIRKQYIIALEEENFHELPGIAYANGYMKKYCELLNIPHFRILC